MSNQVTVPINDKRMSRFSYLDVRDRVPESLERNLNHNDALDLPGGRLHRNCKRDEGFCSPSIVDLADIGSVLQGLLEILVLCERT